MHWKSIEDIDIAQGIKADHTQAIKENKCAKRKSVKNWKRRKELKKKEKKKSSVLRSVIEKTCAENIWVRINK